MLNLAFYSIRTLIRDFYYAARSPGITAAVLHIGSIALEDAGDGCQITADTKSGLGVVCKLLGLKEEAFQTALCFKTISVAGTESLKGLDSRTAQFSREGLAKSLYSKLFDWIVSRSNRCFPCVARHCPIFCTN